MFNFLKDNPTRTLAKGKHVLMTYYNPPDFCLLPFSYKGITVSIEDGDNLDGYFGDGWQVARDYQIASVGNKLADVLGELEHEYIKRQRTGSPLPLMGLTFDWVAYGLTSKCEVLTFVKVFYMNGYSYEQITQLYTSLTKSNNLNGCFLETINTIFKEGMNERIFETA